MREEENHACTFTFTVPGNPLKCQDSFCFLPLAVLGAQSSKMIADDSSHPSLKRKRLPVVDSLDTEAKVKLAIKEKFGRDLYVFETFSPPPTQVSKEETGGFYKLNAEDYPEILATRKEDKFLKTRKIQEAEESAHKSRIRKVMIRVRFPDKHTLEVAFHSSEKIQSLFDLLKKVVARPELPFYIFTTPPKELVKNLSEDFYSGGFIPGAIVYFSYDQPRGDDTAAIYSGPFLREEIMALKGLNAISESAAPVHSVPGQVIAIPSPFPQEPKPA